MKYKTTNWPSYNTALKQRGSLSIWFDPGMIRVPPPSGKRGRQQQFSRYPARMSRADLPCFPLRPGRVHEVCGPAAPVFAACVAASLEGPVLWLREAWQTEMFNPLGLLPFLDPARVLLGRPPSQIDSLALAEESLKDGSLALVVLEITRPLDLREGRRLQLAASTGGTTGLCLIPEGMGSNAAETRWRAMPIFDAAGTDLTPMRWEIIKNKKGTLGAWNVFWNAKAHRLDLVSSTGK